MALSTARRPQDTSDDLVLHVALDLGSSKWHVASCSESSSVRQKSLIAGNIKGLLAEFATAKARFKLPEDAEVVCCYEAGRNGFWIHRFLRREGIESLVVDSASIEVNRRKRQAKTDRIDAEKLLQLLLRHTRGGKHIWRVVNVPEKKIESQRRIHRELERLGKEITGHGNRIRSLLVLHGINVSTLVGLKGRLEELRGPDGTPIPRQYQREISRQLARIAVAKEQIKEVQAERREELIRSETLAAQQVNRLLSLRAIGITTASVLVTEFFAWRKFKNRREVGALAGMVGTPYNSDHTSREQGISKAGNKRVRRLMVEIAWLWLRYQPQSELANWFRQHFGGNKRLRRVGIVALARKLLVALWRFVEHGVLPNGAALKPAAGVTTA